MPFWKKYENENLTYIVFFMNAKKTYFNNTLKF